MIPQQRPDDPRDIELRRRVHAVAEALTGADKNDERFYEAELYRLKGELTLAQSSVQGLASSVQKEAEEYFWKAVEIARKQQAKSLELRATTSLARLWQNQGKQHAARNTQHATPLTFHVLRFTFHLSPFRFQLISEL